MNPTADDDDELEDDELDDDESTAEGDEDESDEVDNGAAVFPEIPAELGVHPMLLVVIHTFVFLDGSDPNIVNPTAADEALEYVALYLQRLSGAELQRAKEDMEVLVGYAKEQKWPKQYLLFLKSFLTDMGVMS